MQRGSDTERVIRREGVHSAAEGMGRGSTDATRAAEVMGAGAGECRVEGSEVSGACRLVFGEGLGVDEGLVAREAAKSKNKAKPKGKCKTQRKGKPKAKPKGKCKPKGKYKNGY